MRFSISGFAQIKYALGTADEHEALALADEKHRDAAFQAKHGILATNGSFRAVALDYVKRLLDEAQRKPEKLREAKYTQRVVDLYLNPFFKTEAITKVGVSRLASYTDWRRTYWTIGPGATQTYAPYQRGRKMFHSKAKHEETTDATLRRENVILRGVFKHAVRKGLLKPGDIPQQEIPKAKTNKRPAFTIEQFTKLVHTSEKRMADAMGKPEILFARAMLHEFICIAADTGMRPKEMFNLNWAHIDGLDLSGKTINQDARIRIHAYGKGKRPAPLFQKNTVPGNFLSIQKIYRFRFKDNPTRETPVFCNIHGERITTFNKSLNALLDACDLRPATCDLRTDAFGRKFNQLNDKVTSHLGASRRVLFETLDKPALKPLPHEPYVYAEWKKCRAGLDYHVDIGRHYYSVPHPLLRQELWARITARTVEIYHKGQRVAVHQRTSGNRQHSTIRDHMPANHRFRTDWTPERIRSRAAQIGPNVETFVEMVMRKRSHPEQGYRTCLGVLRLAKTFGTSRLDAACEPALAE